MAGNITISTATVPEGFCPPWMITEWPELVALLTANLNGALNVFNYGSSTPAPADQGKPWIRLDDGFPTGVWVYKSGFWLKQHPIAPGIVTMWQGDMAALDTFDGGEATVGSVVTETTGPMWKRLEDMNGRFPLGVGTQVTSGTTINQEDQGGEETHLLVTDELPAHSHRVLARSATAGSGDGVTRLAPALATPDDSYGNTGNTGGDLPHNNMPPWTGIGFIYRTARLYYRA